MLTLIIITKTACYDSLQYVYRPVDRRSLVNVGMVPSGADTSDVDDSGEERGTVNPDTEWKRVYYYCTDHLGSSRQVLNSNGQIAETGNYYFGARYLAPRIGIWLSPDPMQLKYPHVSSYAYCMGNPLRFTDPEGKKIVNADGKNAVYYSGGNIVFTKYATHGIRRIVNVLNTIPEGRKILRQVINSPTKVRVSISSDTRISGKTYTYGETTQGNWNPNDNYGRYVASDGTYRIKESFVEIFEGTLVEDAKTSNSKHKGLTIDQAIGAVAAHEFIHATDIQEINKDIHSEMKKRVRENREIKPNQIERNVINQFLENRGE